MTQNENRIRILNLYAGIGGNRKLWGDEYDITAVEYDKNIAAIYKDLFPNDTVIVGDAHQYLLDHYREFDFIWASTPCPTHSNARFWASKGGVCNVEYPDMRLYQEVIFLKHFFKGKYVVENVIPYYDPLIPACKVGRHLFWANFNIQKIKIESNYIYDGKDSKRVESLLGFYLSKYKIKNKTKLLRNCVVPELGLKILENAMNIYKIENVKQGCLDI